MSPIEGPFPRAFGSKNKSFLSQLSMNLIWKQGVYKFNWTNFQEISRRFQEGFQEQESRAVAGNPRDAAVIFDP